MGEQSFSDLTIVLPTLNEAGNIESLANRLLEVLPGSRVIVVDDNSSDGTPDVVSKLAAQNPQVSLIARTVTPCLTDSIQAGIAAATTDYVAWCDADHSHPPEVMRQLYDVAKVSGCCIATRYAESVESFRDRLPKGEMLAAALSGVLNFSVSHLLRLKITDYTSGFIVCRRSLLAEHALQGDYGEYFIELMYYLTRRGVDLREVHYESPPRQWGESKTGASHLLLIRRGVKYLWLVTRLILNRSPVSSGPTS
ncbi:MAG: glycosyltransferase [Polyangiaceae bacterium]